MIDRHCIFVVDPSHIPTPLWASLSLSSARAVPARTYTLPAGSVGEDELVSFFMRGYRLSAQKRSKFAKRSAMHAKIMRVINISQEQLTHRVSAVHQLFAQFDAAGSGVVNADDLGEMISTTIREEVTSEELSLFVKAMDNDGDGNIQERELIHFFLKGLAQHPSKRRAFASRSTFHEKLAKFMESVLDATGTDVFENVLEERLEETE